MDIKAIQTVYKGYRFRSRLEARWAVFFDSLGWNWQYEQEGYKLESGWYLPDFYFPDIKHFGEVKANKFDELEFKKCQELSFLSPVILLESIPDNKSLRLLYAGNESSDCVPVSVGDKYYPLYYTYDFFPNYFTETEKAIIEAKSARFEFGEKGGFNGY